MTPSNAFEELDKSLHERKTFDCGQIELNEFIRFQASRHQQAGISKTLVLPSVEKENKAHICSFYTLSHTEIRRENLPPKLANKLPRYPIPVLLIAQLAVDQKIKSQGFGKITLISALKHCLEINRHLPSFAVVVDALNNEVLSFYKQYGFQELTVGPPRTRLFLPMKTIEALFS